MALSTQVRVRAGGLKAQPFRAAVAAILLLRAAATGKACEHPIEAGDHIIYKYTIDTHTENMTLGSAAEASYAIAGETLISLFDDALFGKCGGHTEELEIVDPYEIWSEGGSGAGKEPQFAADFVHAMESPVPWAVEFSILNATAKEDFEIFELIEQKDLSGIQDMLDRHRGNNAVSEEGMSPLMLSLTDQGAFYTRLFSLLLNAHHPDTDVNAQRPSGHTALFYAVDARDASRLEALLRKGGNPNQKLVTEGTFLGWTPLLFAAHLDQVRHAELLLEYGADPHVKDAKGRSAMEVASLGGAAKGSLDRLRRALDEAAARLIATKAEL